MSRLHLPRALRRRSLLVATGALALAASACVDAPEMSGDVVLGAAEADAIPVAAVDNDFDKEVIGADAGQQVTIEVTNEGERAHNFVIADLDVSTGTLEAGDVASVTLTVPDGGVEYVCTFHGGMRGRISTTT